MLSGLEILKQVELGNIVISDFSLDRLNPNSYNIRLGKKLKVYKNGSITPDMIRAELKIDHPEIVKQYIDLTDIFKNGLSEPDNNALQELYDNYYTIEKELIRKYALDPKKENETVDIEIPEDGYVLFPGMLYLGETEEYTETYGYVPKIDGRSTTGRLGLEVHRTAGFGDNGFKGKWTLEITATHPVVVYPEMEIGQLYYETIEGDSSMQYSGKYQNQQGVQAAKVDKYLLEDDLK